MSMADSLPGSENRLLALIEFRRRFDEIRQCISVSDHAKQRELLKPLIPLFLTAFTNTSQNEIKEKFGELANDFAGLCANALVREMEPKINNSDKFEAAKSISLQLLPGGVSWPLFQSVRILAGGSGQCIERFVQAGLASCFCKILHLLYNFDFNTINVDNEKLNLFVSSFGQLLSRILRSLTATEDLVVRDDLKLLFICASDSSYQIWRRVSSDSLMAIARHSMSANVAHYIQSRGCIQQWVNILREKQAKPLESVERIVSLFCFLQDSSSCTQQLLDSFENSDGYVFLAELLLNLENTLSEDDADCCDAIRNLILLIGSLTTCGFIELKPSSPPSGNQSGFRLPRPMGRGVSVRNIKAFQVLQTVWLRSNSQLITTTILDVVLSLYQQDPANYFILLPQKTIKTICGAIQSKPATNITRFFRVVEWVGLNLGYMLLDEFIPIYDELTKHDDYSASVEFIQGTFKFLEKLILQKRSYKSVIIKIGFVQISSKFLSSNLELNKLICTTTRSIIDGTEAGCKAFEEGNGSDRILDLIKSNPNVDYTFNLLRTLVVNNPASEIKRIMKLLSSEKLDIQVTNLILGLLVNILNESKMARKAFRIANGFEFLEDFFRIFSKSISPEMSDPATGLANLNIITKIEKSINVYAAAVTHSSESLVYSESVLPLDLLVNIMTTWGCFFEAPRFEDEPKTTVGNLEQIQVPYESSKEILAATNLSISTRRVLLIFSPLIKYAVDPKKKIRIPKFIFIILKLLPHVIIIKNHHRHQFQVQILNFVLNLLDDTDNVETLTICRHCQNHMIDILLSPIYVHFIRSSSSTNSALHYSINAIFNIIISKSIKIDYLRNFVRLESPLQVNGISADGGPLNLRTYQTLANIVTSASAIPPAILFDNNLEKSSFLQIREFLQISPDTTLSEFSSATGIASQLTGNSQCWPPVNGFTISIWFSIREFDQTNRAALPILMISKKSSQLPVSLFSILISKGKQVIVTTREVNADVHNQLEELELDPDQCSRIVQNYDQVDSVVGSVDCETNNRDYGQYHHLVVQCVKGFVKQSLCYIWFDGHCVELSNQGRLKYPCNSSSSYNIQSAVNTVALHSGAHDYITRLPCLKWTMSSLHFINEVCQGSFASTIYNFGPSYRGQFRNTNGIVNEESVLIAIYPENGNNNDVTIQNAGQMSQCEIVLSDLPGTYGHGIQYHSGPNSMHHLLGLGGEVLFLSLIDQADSPEKLTQAMKCISLIPLDEYIQFRVINLTAFLIRQKSVFVTETIFEILLDITKTKNGEVPNDLIPIEHLLIDLTLWEHTSIFGRILDHLTELIAKKQSEMNILPSRLCLNLIRYLQDNGDRQEVKVQGLFSHLVKSDDQLRLVGKAMLHASYNNSKSLSPLIKVIQTGLRSDSDFGDRFEKIFGWELPLGMLENCIEDYVNPVLRILSLLLISSPNSGERFLQGNMIQKADSTDKTGNDDLTIETTESETHKEDAPRTLNGFKLLEKSLTSNSSVNVVMTLLGLLVSNPDLPNGIDDTAEPNSLTTSCFSLLYSILRHDLSNDVEETTIVLIPLLLDLYRNHLPKFGKIFFQEELVQKLVSALYPLNLDRNKLDVTVEKAQKMIVDLVIALFTNSVSLGCGSVVFKNVSDAIVGIVPPGGSSPMQQKNVFSLLVDSIQSFVRLTNLPWNWPVHLEYNQRLTTIGNLSCFFSRSVERIWEFGSFENPLFDLTHTIANLLVRSRYNKAPKNVLESLEKSVWRCLIFNISKSTQTEYDQLQVTSSLELIIEFKAILFPTSLEGSKESIEYCLVLIYCLFQLSGDSHGLSFINHSDGTTDQSQRSNPPPPIHPKLMRAINAIWNILLAARCLEFESQCRVSIPPGSSIEVGRLLLRELAKKSWTSFIENMKPKANATGGIMRNITGSFGKFTSSTRRALQVKRTASVTDAMSWLRTELDFLNESVAQDMKDTRNYDHQVQEDTQNEWTSIKDGLMTPGGLFGSDSPDQFVRWMLDTSEGPARTRRRMIKNSNFYSKYTPSYSDNGKHRNPKSAFSDELHRLKNPELPSPKSSQIRSPCDPKQNQNSEIEIDINQGQDADIESIAKNLVRSARIQSDASEPEDCFSPTTEPLSPTTTDVPNFTSNNAESSQKNSVLQGRILDKGDKVRYTMRMGRVTGLDAYEGILVIGKINCYLIDGLGLTSDNKIKLISEMSPEEQVFVIPPSRQNENLNCSVSVHKFQISKIRNIEKRRYLLQPIALELFLQNGRTYLIAFERNERQKALQRIVQYATHARSTDPSTMMNSLTSKWENGEISNFEYIVILNTWAGRTYNDLMQYPVFPWVLSDYDSNVLDFTKSETFRDFSLPMGAQATERLAQFKKRYKELCELGVDSDPYYYGTHYSSAMIVSSFLVRLEPFTDYFLRLQGGHFDLPDRMFHSIKEAWLSASTRNNADVRELIPEFFYLPEFLSNHNKFDLGRKQSGIGLDDVVLPPWARGSQREFVRIHRSALESPYVSSTISQWIDLIFGYKQQGPSALEVHNLFHPLFYEGQVDVFSIQDPLQRNAAIGFINNFGQIPTKLFKKPHPQRKGPWNRVSITEATLMTGPKNAFYTKINQVRPSEKPIMSKNGPISSIMINERGDLIALTKGTVKTVGNRNLIWNSKDASLKFVTSDGQKHICSFENKILSSSKINCCTTINEDTLIFGHCDSTITAFSVDLKTKEFKLESIIRGHASSVLVLRAIQEYGILVSGCSSGRIMMWDMSNWELIRLVDTLNEKIVDLRACWITGDIFVASEKSISVFTINGTPLGSVSIEGVTCVAAPAGREWERPRILLSGHTDGTIRVWARELVPSRSPNSTSSNGSVSDCNSNRSSSSGTWGMSVTNWTERLVMRGKLTLGNAKPISSFGIYHDHSQFFSGDVDGNVFSWHC